MYTIVHLFKSSSFFVLLIFSLILIIDLYFFFSTHTCLVTCVRACVRGCTGAWVLQVGIIMGILLVDWKIDRKRLSGEVSTIFMCK